MSLVEKVRDTDRVDAEDLTRRLEALTRFLRLVDPYLPDGELVTAHTLVERASGRLTLSLDHTVVALAGSTGSGKSSLFNALARFKLSPVGVRRPTTGTAHAVVWGPLEPANRLLDWVGVLPRQRFVRESALDGDDEASLRGLVLLDLPDFDSVEQAHQLEVDRLLGLVDQIVWVVDPQKYGDRILHRAYLSQFSTHAGVTIVVLNQADRLSASDTEAVLADLRRLLEEDGLTGAPVLASSAKQPGMLGELRDALESTVAGRQAALRRLAVDVDVAGEELAAMMGPPAAEDEVDRATHRLAAGPRAAPAASGPPAQASPRGQGRDRRGVDRHRPADLSPGRRRGAEVGGRPVGPCGRRACRRAAAGGLGAGPERRRTVQDRRPAGRAGPGDRHHRPGRRPQAGLVAAGRGAAVDSAGHGDRRAALAGVGLRDECPRPARHR